MPHILEDIFFLLDYNSYKSCMKVSRSWKDLLTSESFLKRGKSAFHDNIKLELRSATIYGNVGVMRDIFSTFDVDRNILTDKNDSPLIFLVEYQRESS